MQIDSIDPEHEEILEHLPIATIHIQNHILSPEWSN